MAISFEILEEDIFGRTGRLKVGEKILKTPVKNTAFQSFAPSRPCCLASTVPHAAKYSASRGLAVLVRPTKIGSVSDDVI